MKLNNKGFAVSSVLYLILVFAIIIMALSLSTSTSRKIVLDKEKKIALEFINNS